MILAPVIGLLYAAAVSFKTLLQKLACDQYAGRVAIGIVLHAFEGKAPFSERNLQKIQDLKKIYELDLTSADSHRLVES